MKGFEELMDRVSESKDINPKSVEFPKDCTEVCETKEEKETLKDLIESGKIQMSWTKVNTSNHCGCNNACFNSCYNIG